MTPEKLRADLSRAAEAARKAIENMPDGGTCCLDRVFIPTGKNAPIKRRTAAFTQAVFDAGGCTANTHWWTGYFVMPDSCGQGATRTVACEHMANSLRAAGWDACVYYQMD